MKLTVYIPTASRPDACLQQIQALDRERLSGVRGLEVRIVISVNGDPKYTQESLMGVGADEVRIRAVNLGGDANFCLGLECLADADYLWVISDDDPIEPEALKRISNAIQLLDSPDLITLSDSATRISLLEPMAIGDLDGLPIASISCSVYRSDAFRELVPLAFSGIVSHFPQISLIQAGIRLGMVRRVGIVPTEGIIDLAPMRNDALRRGRSEMGERTGAFFFGGSLLAYLEPDPLLRKQETRMWWRRHWHRLSMYRRARSPEQHLVDQLGRSSISTVGWWLISLPPWWRLKTVSDQLCRQELQN